MTATRTPRSNRFQLAKQQLCSCITLFGTFLTHCYTTTTSNFTFCQGQEHKKTTSFLFEILNCGGGGEDRGVTISRLPYPILPPPVRFCPSVSRLPPFIVFLPLSCKSPCLTPYSHSNGECFGLVQNKKLSGKSSHSALSSEIIEAAFLRHKQGE